MEHAASSRERDVDARGRAPSAEAFRFEMTSLIGLIAVVVIAANAVVLALVVRSEYRRWRSDDPR
jgi:hypothetical protein